MPRTIVDADGHVGEPKDLFERYLDVPLGGRKPYLTRDDRGIDRWVIEGRPTLLSYAAHPAAPVGDPPR